LTVKTGKYPGYLPLGIYLEVFTITLDLLYCMHQPKNTYEPVAATSTAPPEKVAQNKRHHFTF